MQQELGHEAIKYAEMNSLIAPEQYISRKGKGVIEYTLNNRLGYDLIHKLQYPETLCSNDTKIML